MRWDPNGVRLDRVAGSALLHEGIHTAVPALARWVPGDARRWALGSAPWLSTLSTRGWPLALGGGLGSQRCEVQVASGLGLVVSRS
jgi:hypothetical protein